MHTEPFMVGNCRWHMYGAWQEIPEDDPQLISWKNKEEERLARIKKKDRDCFLLTRTALLAGLCDYGVLWYCLDDQFPLVDELFVVLLIGAMFAFFWSLKRMVVEVFNAEVGDGRGADPSGGVGVVGLKRKGFRFPTRSPCQSHICERFTALMGVSTNATDEASSSVQNCEQ